MDFRYTSVFAQSEEHLVLVRIVSPSAIWFTQEMSDEVSAWALHLVEGDGYECLRTALMGTGDSILMMLAQNIPAGTKLELVRATNCQSYHDLGEVRFVVP